MYNDIILSCKNKVFKIDTMKYIYADNAATTKIDPRVLDEMMPYLKETFANPSSIHSMGQRSRRAIDRSRECIASYIGCDIQEIVFTSGGTESNNLAIKGMTLKNKGHVITSAIEHDSILKPISEISENRHITYINPDSMGHISTEDVKNNIRDDTVLISIIHANSEIGTLQDIKTISQIAHEKGIPVHTDAMQSFKYENIMETDADLITFGSHKIHGPKGIGALYIKRQTQIKPMITGGEQEYKMRGGTESTALIVGFAKAVEILKNEREERYKYVKNLQSEFEKEILSQIPGSRINGGEEKLPDISNIYLKDILAETLLINLDREGIEASAGSACTALSIEPSHTLKAIGMTDDDAKRAIRFSFSHENTTEDIHTILKVIYKIHKAQF